MAKSKMKTDVVVEELKPKGWADDIPVYCAHDDIVPLVELKPNPANPNKHPIEQLKRLGAVIRSNGWRAPITISTRSGMIVKGHGRMMAAEIEELTTAPVDYQDYESDAAELADLYADNHIAELAEPDQGLAAELLASIQSAGAPLEMAGTNTEEYDRLVSALTAGAENDEEDDGGAGNDEAAAAPDEPVTRRGDVWILGRHRVMCGDATSKEDVERLLAGDKPEILITDPPYCSGGFQESGKSSGSIGTKRKAPSGAKWTTPKIANDRLSTRGYMALLKSALQNSPATIAYICTDWRMWTYLYDVVETCCMEVRQMLVWDKQTPGMGIGWRSQHELIMMALTGKPLWDPHKGYGNVLTAPRSGNKCHPTQKPLELIAALLDNTSWASGVLDFFGGSGTTLIAAEDAGQKSYTMELTPSFVDVIVERYIRHTGRNDVKCIRGERALSRDEILPIIERVAETR